MAEVVIGTAASVITLVSLLTNCVEALELIQIAKTQDKDLEKLDLKLMLEQCRLKAWGKSMGLIREDSGQKRTLLDGFEFREHVQQALHHILTLLTDSNRLSKKYGGQQVAIEASSSLAIRSGQSPSVSKLMAAFKRIKINDSVREQAGKVKSKSVWVFHDRKKYIALISEVRDLVDTVEKLTKDIVSQAQQEHFMVSRINAISDLRTLNMVTEVCEQDHPAYSDAASNRADVVSMTTTRRGDVAVWVEQVDIGGAASDDSEDLESLDVTELKRRILILRGRRKRLQGDADIKESRLAYQEDELADGRFNTRAENLQDAQEVTDHGLLQRLRMARPNTYTSPINRIGFHQSAPSTAPRSRVKPAILYLSSWSADHPLDEVSEVSRMPSPQSKNMMRPGIPEQLHVDPVRPMRSWEQDVIIERE